MDSVSSAKSFSRKRASDRRARSRIARDGGRLLVSSYPHLCERAARGSQSLPRQECGPRCRTYHGRRSSRKHGTILPADVDLVFEKGSWEVHPVFPWLQRLGNVPEPEMYHVFNMESDSS